MSNKMSLLSLPVKEEHRTAFFGEDIHIDVPPGNAGEVVFKPRTNRSAEVVLMRAGKVNNTRCHVNSLGHLVVEDVQEEDEGVYIIKNSNNPNAVKRLILIVRGKLAAALFFQLRPTTELLANVENTNSQRLD